jgi:hypothetical protein
MQLMAVMSGAGAAVMLDGQDSGDELLPSGRTDPIMADNVTQDIDFIVAQDTWAPPAIFFVTSGTHQGVHYHA